MLEEAQKCGDVYAVYRDGIGRRVTQQGPHLARPHIVAKEMLSSEANYAEARTSSSLASFDHALRPDDTAFVRGFGLPARAKLRRKRCVRTCWPRGAPASTTADSPLF